MTVDMIEEREKLIKEIARTSESIRKKHRMLKTGRMEEEAELERQFKPIVEPLKQIAENIGVDEPQEATLVTPSLKITNEAKNKRKRVWSTEKKMSKRINTLSASPIQTSTPLQPRKLSFEPSKNLLTENVFETTNPSLVTSVRQTMQEDPKALYNQMGPLGQKYIGALLSGDKQTKMDTVYGVYFNDAGTFLGDKAFDIDIEDNLIVDGVKYAGTPGLFELIFNRIPDDAIYTEQDKQKYKSLLLVTNAHRRGHNALLPVLGNKGYKYKNIIAPLLSLNSKRGGGITSSSSIVLPECSTRRNVTPQTMTVTNNKIDYVHWDDPNELVDRLRLLDASQQAGNNAHDNEFLSIIEELREAGLIIN